MFRWLRSLKAKLFRSRARTAVIRAQEVATNVDASETNETPDLSDGDITQFVTLFLRSTALHTRYEESEDLDALNETIILRREALSHCPPDIRSAALDSLAISLSSRHERLGGIDDLREAIILLQEALSLCPPGHPDRLANLNSLALHLSSRHEQLGVIDDLNEAIVLDREALSLCPPGHSDRAASLNNLAVHLSSRHEQLGGIDDLNEAIVLGRGALSLRPPGHPDRLGTLDNLAADLASRYEQLGVIDDLKVAIVLVREILSLRAPAHPDRSVSLSNLAVHLSSQFGQLGVIGDLNDAIILDREALSLRPPGHLDRSESLSNLGAHLSSRYEQLGVIDDINEAIGLAREALSLRPPGHLDRSASLNNLAAHLSSRYKQLGVVDDLNEAIILDRDAISLRPSGHSDRSQSLSNLAADLSSRYERLGEIDDLNEAIVLGREALSLRPPSHPDRSTSLNNLAVHISSRYEQLGVTDDVNEAIDFVREALSLRPPGHPDHAASLSSLAVHLSLRHNRLGDIDDLNEAIVLSREACSVYPLGHPERAVPLNNLAAHLSFRYKQLGAINDLDEAIVFAREALSLRPPGHPARSMSLSNLTTQLSSRYQQLRVGDLDEAITVAQEALSLRPPGHPYRSVSLNDFATLLSSSYKHSKEIDGPSATMEDKLETLFGLYAELEYASQTVSTHDLLAARAWVDTAEEFHHSTTVSAYETALRLLVEHVATLPPLPQHFPLLKSVSSSLAVDAFSACLRNQSPTKAVELLEQGRGVFWSQLTRLRSPLGDVISSGPQGKALADEFTRLTSLIRMALHSHDPEHHDQHDRVCSLNVQLKKAASDIRELPGLSRFLLPPLFSDLRCAARDGPIIIVNSSKYGCDALVVFADKDPVHIPLLVTKEDVQKLSLDLHTLRQLATQRKMDVTTDFQSFLRELWDRVVFHIIDVLRRTCPRQSRIWWCPTAEFSSLPLHAAAPYRNDEESVSDLFISSYTTSLTALIRARRPDTVKSDSERKHFIAIGQAESPGFKKLHTIHTELTNVRRHVKAITTFTRIEGKDAHISGVADKLSENEWVHFACHGSPNQDRPFESAFGLRDGLFTIQDIIQCNLQNSEFAYLSACQTTVGDKESPDEVIHLVSAMQFAGFRSVVGTMWSVTDSPATKVASTFYKLMVDESGCLDHTRAAWALWKTLRIVDIPMDQRILFIHLGA